MEPGSEAASDGTHLDLSVFEYPTMAVDEAVSVAAAQANRDLDAQSEGAQSSLSDSTYEIISHSSSRDSDDEEISAHDGTESLQSFRAATPDDDDSDVADDEQDSELVEVETPTSTAKDEADEAEETDSSSVLRSVIDDSIFSSRTIKQSTDHIEFEEPSVAWRSGFIDVVHTVSGNVAKPGFPPRFLTIAQSMTNNRLKLKRPFRIWYFGKLEMKTAIVDKIVQALSLSVNESEDGGILDNSRMHLVTLPSTSPGSDSPRVTTIPATGLEVVVHERGMEFFEDVHMRHGLSLWARRPNGPDLAVFTHTQGERDHLSFRNSRMVARLKIPTIDIDTSLTDWKELPHFIPFELKAVHMCIESRNEAKGGRREILTRLPIDLESFLEVDPRQMNRNIACITSIYQKDRVDIALHFVECIAKIAKQSWVDLKDATNQYKQQGLQWAERILGDREALHKFKQAMLPILIVVLLHLVASVGLFAYLSCKNSPSCGAGNMLPSPIANVFGLGPTPPQQPDYPGLDKFLPTIEGHPEVARKSVVKESSLSTMHPETGLSNPSVGDKPPKIRKGLAADVWQDEQGHIFLNLSKKASDVPGILKMVTATCEGKQHRIWYTELTATSYQLSLDPPKCSSPVTIILDPPKGQRVVKLFQLPEAQSGLSFDALAEAFTGLGLPVPFNTMQAAVSEHFVRMRAVIDLLAAHAYEDMARVVDQSTSLSQRTVNQAKTAMEQWQQTGQSFTAEMISQYPRRKAEIKHAIDRRTTDISRAVSDTALVAQKALHDHFESVQNMVVDAYTRARADRTRPSALSIRARENLPSISLPKIDSQSFQKARKRALVVASKIKDRVKQARAARESRRVERKAARKAAKCTKNSKSRKGKHSHCSKKKAPKVPRGQSPGADREL